VIRARILYLLVAVGCASPMSTLREDNRRLHQTVTDLRGDRRAQDRKLRDMQHQLDELRAKVAVDVAASVPALPVEVAAPAPAGPAPADARVVAIADDGTEIVYEGEAAAARAVAPVSLPGSASPAGDPPPRRAPSARPVAPLPEVPVVADRLEVTRRVPPISARAARRTRDLDGPAERGGDAAGDYRVAVELVKAGKHDDAVAALRAFVARYPRHDYADNAQYWLGEAFYAQADYGRALTELRKVIEVYPRGNKVPDALLKVGYCHQAIGQTVKARAVLEQVVKLYPKSEPAMLAAKRLETP
jgi:tol-pal system protein YbgF